MQGLIVVATLIALVASIVVINSRQKPIIRPKRKPAIKRQPINIRMMKRRYLKRTQRIQQHYQQEQLRLFMLLLYHSYRCEQTAICHN
ncbi:MAG: hypothetical protein LCH85_22270 [Chloroflexi bacterium]|nr:hypothetical protein [Chloroflexota bacterium]